MRRSQSQSVTNSSAREAGSATLFSTYFALLLIGASALATVASAQIGARRAEVRKIEAVGLAAMDSSGRGERYGLPDCSGPSRYSLRIWRGRDSAAGRRAPAHSRWLEGGRSPAQQLRSPLIPPPIPILAPISPYTLF